MDSLERVLRPIIEGQLHSFTYDHPEVVEAVNWYRRRPDKRVTFVNSIAKRILRDLLCPNTRARLVAALVEPSDCESSSYARLADMAGAQGDGVGLHDCPVLPEEDLEEATESKGEVAPLTASPSSENV